MTSGSIYIDPDGVSSVSSQMLKTADEIDALRHNIVPQVYNAVEMSYPSLNVLPQVGPSVGAAHDNIGYFACEAETVAHELRTSAYVLNQVASEGRLMIEQLLQQSTMFMSPGRGTSSSVGSWITQVEKTLGVDWNTASQIVWSILQSDQFKKGTDIFGSLLSTTEVFKKMFPAFETFMKDNPYLKQELPILGIGLSILSGGDYSPKTIVADIIGGVIDIGINCIPYAPLVTGAIALIGLGAQGLSSGQNFIAQGFDGNVKNQLLDTSNNWSIEAKNLNLGTVENSIGLAITDAAFDHQNFAGDTEKAIANTGNFVLAFGQLQNNLNTTVTDDGLALIDKTVQVLPVPQNWKVATNNDIGNLMQSMNQTANIVIKPSDVANAWNWTKGLF